MPSFCQENNALEFNSFSSSGGIYQLEKINDGIGFSASIDLEFSLGNHLLTPNINVGYGILNKDDILKNAVHLFIETNFLYGRQFEILDTVYFRLFSGVGFTEQTKLKNASSGGSLNIPLRGQLLFNLSDSFCVGIQSQISFNTINDIYMYHFFLRFRF